MTKQEMINAITMLIRASNETGNVDIKAEIEIAIFKLLKQLNSNL